MNSARRQFCPLLPKHSAPAFQRRSYRLRDSQRAATSARTSVVQQGEIPARVALKVFGYTPVALAIIVVLVVGFTFVPPLLRSSSPASASRSVPVPSRVAESWMSALSGR
jgi:hypothetical protein